MFGTQDFLRIFKVGSDLVEAGAGLIRVGSKFMYGWLRV